MHFKPYTLLIIIVLIAGCKDKKHHHETDHNKSNVYMNKNSFEELVKRFEDPSRASWQKPDEVIAMLGDINGKTIMDIGAGTGYFSFRLADKGATVIAADVDKRFLHYIEEKKSETNNNAVMTRLVPYDDAKLTEGEVDAVIIVDTYHHIEDRVNYFRRVLKGLKPDGQLMVVDFKKEESPQGPPLNHRLSSGEVTTELEKAGFTAIEINTMALAYQYIIIAGKPDQYKEITTASGLQYKILKRGKGGKVTEGQEVVFHEKTSYPDGTLLYTTRETGKPLTILIGGNQAIKGVDEGIRGMQPGEVRRLTVPPALSKRTAYPSFLSPDSTLVYEIELIEIKK